MSDDGSDQEEMPKRELHEVKEEVQQKLLESFQRFDEEGLGYIQTNEVKLVIECMGIQMEDKEIYKIISDIDPSNNGHIYFHDIQPIIVDYQVERIMGTDEAELLQAYVAMGGEADGGGCVDADKLISTIKNEF